MPKIGNGSQFLKYYFKHSHNKTFTLLLILVRQDLVSGLSICIPAWA